MILSPTTVEKLSSLYWYKRQPLYKRNPDAVIFKGFSRELNPIASTLMLKLRLYEVQNFSRFEPLAVFSVPDIIKKGWKALIYRSPYNSWTIRKKKNGCGVVSIRFTGETCYFICLFRSKIIKIFIKHWGRKHIEICNKTREFRVKNKFLETLGLVSFLTFLALYNWKQTKSLAK